LGSLPVSDPTSSSGDPGAFADALARARELLQVEGSPALRLQAQQQAALELLQARKFGASEDELEALLTGVVETSLERLLS
jgi:hypothetical protein